MEDQGRISITNYSLARGTPAKDYVDEASRGKFLLFQFFGIKPEFEPSLLLAKATAEKPSRGGQARHKSGGLVLLKLKQAQNEKFHRPCLSLMIGFNG